MSSSIQLPTEVQRELDTLLSRKYHLLDTIEQIKLEKAAYIKDMEGFEDLYSSSTASEDKTRILILAKKRHAAFIKKVDHLTSLKG